jgi:plastocyanin
MPSASSTPILSTTRSSGVFLRPITPASGALDAALMKMNIKASFMFTDRFSAVLAIPALLLACSSQRPLGAAGSASTGGGDNTGNEGPRGGSTTSTGGSSSGEHWAGGDAGAALVVPGDGQGGETAGSEGGSSGETAEGGSGEPTAGSGGKPPEPSHVNGCFAFVDRTDDAASRTIVWDDALIFDPARCLRVRVGQTVVFAGNHDNHPMMPKGGDTPNPVGPSAVFPQVGVFGYECIPHPSEMNGAIEVVP